MSLEVGSVVARLGAHLDDSGFTSFERRLRSTRQDAEKGAHATLKTTADTAGMDRYNRTLQTTEKSHEELIRGSGRLRGAFGNLVVGGAGVAAAGIAFETVKGAVEGTVSAFEHSEKIAKQTEAVLKSTGGAAHVTAKEVDELAQAISRKSGIDDETIKSSENMLLTFTNVRNEVGKGNDIFNQATQVVTDMSVALGQDSKNSAIQLGKALNDPIRGLTSLSRVGVAFDTSTRNQIKTLVAHGKTLQAQKIIIAELNKEFGGSAAAQATAGAKMGVAWDNVKEAIGKRLVPVINTGARLLTKFANGFTDGTGAGGKFRNVLDDIGKVTSWLVTHISDLVGWFKRHHDATVALTSVVLGLVVAFTALKVLATVRSGIGSVTDGFKKLKLAFAENPIGAVATVLITLGVAFVNAYEHSKTFRDIVNSVLRAVRDAALDFADKFLGVVTTVLGGIQKMVEVASHVPIIGDKFKGLAGDIQSARDNIDGFRESLRKTDSAQSDAGGSTDNLRKRVKDARRAYSEARDELGKYQKGTDAYREAARKAAVRAKGLHDAIDDQRDAARHAVRPMATLVGNVAGLGQVVADTAESVGGNVNSTLKELGAKGLSYTIKRPRAAGQAVGNAISQVSGLLGFAGGGIPNPGSGARDDHVLLDPHGQPVAMMSGTEGILNRPQMPIVDFALATTAALGLQPYAGLGDLWGAGMRHYAAGGLLERANALDRMHLPYVWGGHHGDRFITDPRPGLDCSSTVSYLLGIPPRVSGQFETFGQPGPGPVTIFANPEHVFMSIFGRGYGTSHENPGGGPGWLSYNSRPGFVVRHVAGDVGGLGSIDAPTIQGPPSTLKRVATAAARAMARAGNGAVQRAMGAMNSLSGQPLQEGAYSKRALERLWVQANGNLGDPHLMAAIALAESRGNANAVNGPYNGLWQVGPGGPMDPLANARAAGEKLRTQGLGAWQTYTEGTYRSFLGLGGLIRRFAGGGPLRAARHSSHAGAGAYNDAEGAVDTLRKDYSLEERRYNETSDDELLKPDGTVNQRAWNRKTRHLAAMGIIARNIVSRLQDARRAAARVMRANRTIIRRLSASLRHARRKDRAGIRNQLANARTSLSDFTGYYNDLHYDVANARLDWSDLGSEYAAMQDAVKPPTPDPSSADTSPADTGTGTDPGSTDAPPSADDIAAGVAQALASFNAGRSDLYAQFGANFVAAGAPMSPYAATAGPRAYGAFGAAGGVGDQPAAGPTIINHFAAPPEDPHTWTHQQRYALESIF